MMVLFMFVINQTEFKYFDSHSSYISYHMHVSLVLFLFYHIMFLCSSPYLVCNFSLLKSSKSGKGSLLNISRWPRPPRMIACMLYQIPLMSCHTMALIASLLEPRC